MNLSRFLIVLFVLLSQAVLADDGGAFSDEQLSVAEFWAAMGPTLRDKGIDAYASRYHDDFRHWDIGRGGQVVDKQGAVTAWGGFHRNGHRITCTHVTPISVRIFGRHAVARLLYEEEITMASGEVRVSLMRMVAVFERAGQSWQVLETNMLLVTPGKDDEKLVYQCSE